MLVCIFVILLYFYLLYVYSLFLSVSLPDLANKVVQIPNWEAKLVNTQGIYMKDFTLPLTSSCPFSTHYATLCVQRGGFTYVLK